MARLLPSFRRAIGALTMIKPRRLGAGGDRFTVAYRSHHTQFYKKAGAVAIVWRSIGPRKVGDGAIILWFRHVAICSYRAGGDVQCKSGADR